VAAECSLGKNTVASKGQKQPKPPKHRTLSLLPETLNAIEEMDSSNPRTAAIVGLAFLENNLALAIMSRLRPLSEKEQKNLFESALLASFSAKIDIAFALNLVGDKVRCDLSNLNRIRNRFAHYLQVRDFDHPEVAGLCDALLYPRYKVHTKRTRQPTRDENFRDTIAHLADRFSKETKYPHRPPDPTVRFTPDY
jgi:hypothetical protein